jgi:hypothetical protein
VDTSDVTIARLMRQIVVARARARDSVKRTKIAELASDENIRRLWPPPDAWLVVSMDGRVRARSRGIEWLVAP